MPFHFGLQCSNPGVYKQGGPSESAQQPERQMSPRIPKDSSSHAVSWVKPIGALNPHFGKESYLDGTDLMDWVYVSLSSVHTHSCLITCLSLHTLVEGLRRLSRNP